MSGLFIKILNLSFAASFLIVACILVRFAFKKMPKYVRILLWLLVAVRLLVPFEIESPLSLQPAKKFVSVSQSSEKDYVMNDASVAIDSEQIASIQKAALQKEETAQVAAVTSEESNSFIGISDRSVYDVLAVIWLIGAMGFIIYGFVMYFRLLYCVRDAVRITPNVYQTEKIVSPFVLGIFRARIYMPYNLTLKEQFFVMNHEQAHIKRKDHLIKPAAFAVAAIYWFNPLVWVAYILLCRDIEFACDEKVIERIGYHMKKEYSQSILDLSVPRRYIAACPVAFGETGVKERVRNILNMKKTKKIVLITAVLAVAAVGIGFMTYPKKDNTENEAATEAAEVTEEVTEEVASVETTEADVTKNADDEDSDKNGADKETDNESSSKVSVVGASYEEDKDAVCKTITIAEDGNAYVLEYKDGSWSSVDNEAGINVVSDDGKTTIYLENGEELVLTTDSNGDASTPYPVVVTSDFVDEETPQVEPYGSEAAEDNDTGVEQPVEEPPIEED